MTPRSEPRAWRAIGRAFEEGTERLGIMTAILDHEYNGRITEAMASRLLTRLGVAYLKAGEMSGSAKAVACYWLALEAEEEG